jgi:TIGR03009 family protein
LAVDDGPPIPIARKDASMNRSIRRVAIFLCLIGFSGLGAAFGQQGRNESQPRLATPSARGGYSGPQRSTNPQAPPGRDGWQSGAEPRGAAAPTDQRAGAPPQNNQPVAGHLPQQPPPPFILTREEEARLDQILIAWEKQSGNVKTYKCDFVRLEYGTVFGQNPADSNKPRTISYGQLKYSAPDKGMFKVTATEFYNPKTGAHERGGPESHEHWVCDGRSIFEINHKEKTRTERPLPPEMQGAAISDGPLPFVFGAKKAKLKARYWMREIASPNAANEIWLQAFPRFQADAANFKFVEIIIDRKTFMPKAIQLFSPAYAPERGNDSRTVFDLQKASYNGRLDNVFTDFVAPDVDFRYKKIILQPQVEQPMADGAPQRNGARQAQAPKRGPTR